jgi:hypothetical protein
MTPGSTASAVVLTEHVEPTVVLALAAHGTVTGNGRSAVVPPSTGAVPFSLSVMRSTAASSSSPV